MTADIEMTIALIIAAPDVLIAGVPALPGLSIKRIAPTILFDPSIISYISFGNNAM
jgi:hypothetical protein